MSASEISSRIEPEPPTTMTTTIPRSYTTNYPLEMGITGTRIVNYPLPKRGDLFWRHYQPMFVLFKNDYCTPRDQTTLVYTGLRQNKYSTDISLRFVEIEPGNSVQCEHFMSISIWEELGRNYLQPKKRLPYQIRCTIKTIPNEQTELEVLYNELSTINNDCKHLIASFLATPYSISRRIHTLQVVPNPSRGV